jgi:geranylgeranyl pyrophosphate synthase
MVHTDKIQSVLQIYERFGAAEYVKSKADNYFQKAMSHMNALSKMNLNTEPLMEIITAIQGRKN